MKLAVWMVVFCGVVTLGWSQSDRLGVARELTLAGPWEKAVALEFPEEGRYRLEVLEMGGDPVEVVVERRTTGNQWVVEASNRTDRGVLLPAVEWNVIAGDQRRVRPVAGVPQTVVIRLNRASFTGFKEALKRGLTTSGEVSTPVRQRFELPPGTGGPLLAAVEGAGGRLFLGWLSEDGRTAQVWDHRGNRWGQALRATEGTRWDSLEVVDQGPSVVLRGEHGPQAWTWSGGNWVPEAAPSPTVVTTPQGTFRWTVSPEIRVWRWTTEWIDLELPRHRGFDQCHVGSTADALYVLIASSRTGERGFYSWHPDRGWVALELPRPSLEIRPELVALTREAGSLYLVEASSRVLTLRPFDGEVWKPAVDLSALVQRNLRAIVTLPPSTFSKTGLLIVATDRVSVYDLP